MSAVAPPVGPLVLTVHQIGFAADGPAWRAVGTTRGAPWAFYRHLRNLDWELRAIARADHVVTMSAEDAGRLRRFLPQLQVSVSPVGVDGRAYAPPAETPEPTADVLFVGNFHHPPNVDAVEWLASEVLPRAGRRIRTRIVGREMPDTLRRSLDSHGVDVVGPVDDVRPQLARARVVVAPVRFGTGMRGKVLEALAMARPLVTTSVGAEGLGAVPGTHLLVADDAAAFAGAIVRLLDEPATAARLGTAGRALVASRFDWAAIAARHEHVYEETLAGRPLKPQPPRDRANGLRHAARRLPMPWNGLLGAALLAQRGLRWYLRAQR